MLRPAALAIVALYAAGPAPEDARSDQAAPAPPIFLEFLNAPAAGQPITDVPRLAIGVAGTVRAAVVDTGSTGVLLSASSIPGVDRLPSLGPGTLTYSSSGRIMRGRWVVTPLVIAGRNSRVTTRPLPVLAVDAIDCTVGARHCTPSRDPRGVAMLGIGFGREHDHQSGGTPDRNPLLNLASVGSHSYTISRRGIAFGAAREGFALVALARDAADRDWLAPPACITLGTGRRSCGTALVDTGITGMFLTLPPDRLADGGAGGALPDHSAISIELVPADERRPALGYVVHAGDGADAATPSSVILAGIGKRPTFVNTGVRLLDRFDYFYDADAGLVGYRPAALEGRR